jgi:hypothetical protein
VLALGDHVAAGFPRRGRRVPSLARPPRVASPDAAPRLPALAVPRRRMLALAGAAASLLVVIGVALSVSGTDTRDAAPVGETAEPAAQAPSDDLALRTPPAGGAVQVPPAGAGAARVAPGERERRIERSAELTLAAPEDELDRVADSIVGVTDRHEGFVLRSSVSTGDDSEGGGTFDLRIPAASLQEALRDLSKLGHVRARSQSGRDVTPAFVSSRDRLSAARAERRSLLRRLAAADSDRAAEAIRRRLDAVSLRIDRLRRELGALRERTDYVAVAVTLEAEGDDGGAATGGTREALDDSLGLLAGSLNLALRALGVLIPVGIVAGLGWLGGTMLRRRRREAALR